MFNVHKSSEIPQGTSQCDSANPTLHNDHQKNYYNPHVLKLLISFIWRVNAPVEHFNFAVGSCNAGNVIISFKLQFKHIVIRQRVQKSFQIEMLNKTL